MLSNGLQKFEIAFIIAFLSLFVNYINGIEFPIDTTKYEFSECKTSDGLDGECRRLNDCPSGKIKLEKSDFCSYLKEFPLYCCAMIEEKIPIVTNTENSTVATKRLVDRICEEYYPGLTESVRAKRFLPEEYPHMTAIGWKNFDGNVDWNCGGSVINNKFILTAAHCTEFKGSPPDRARAGGLKLLVTEDSTLTNDYNITAVYAHPDYKPPAVYHDIALLRVSPDFSGIKPACLWTSDIVPVDELLGMGYGTTLFGGPRSNVLLEGSLAILSQEECKKSIVTDTYVPNGIITGQFCAQDPNHIKDTCQGDSGGPLQFHYGSGDTRRPVIVGITSYGQFCGGRLPGVYTRVSTYLDWIESVIMSVS